MLGRRTSLSRCSTGVEKAKRAEVRACGIKFPISEKRMKEDGFEPDTYTFTSTSQMGSSTRSEFDRLKF